MPVTRRILLLACQAALQVAVAGFASGTAAAEDTPCAAGIEEKRLAAVDPPPPPVPAAGDDFRHRLNATAYGWPRRDHWCVWIEPVSAEGPAARWDLAWRRAVEAALSRWSDLVPITVVDQQQRAQVLIQRRRPPLRGGRASHGRAELALVMMRRQGEPQLEPLVTVQISPGQRPEAMQATALHELGHAFGLWGHSDRAGDAMAAVPGATPVLELSPRDRASFVWLQRQSGLGLKAPACVAGACAP